MRLEPSAARGLHFPPSTTYLTAYHRAVVFHGLCPEPLPVDQLLHVVVGEKLPHLAIAPILQETQLFRSPWVGSDAFDGNERGGLAIERGAVEAEINGEVGVDPLPCPAAAFVADSVERVCELFLEEGLRFLL